MYKEIKEQRGGEGKIQEYIVYYYLGRSGYFTKVEISASPRNIVT